MTRYAHYQLARKPTKLEPDERMNLQRIMSGLRVIDRHMQNRFPTIAKDTDSDDYIFRESIPIIKALMQKKEYDYLEKIPWIYIESHLFMAIREWRKLEWLKGRHCAIDREEDRLELWLTIADEIKIEDGYLRLPGITTGQTGLELPFFRRFPGYPKIVHIVQDKEQYVLEILYEHYSTFPDPTAGNDINSWSQRVYDAMSREASRTPRQRRCLRRDSREGINFREQRAYEYRAKIFNRLKKKQTATDLTLVS